MSKEQTAIEELIDKIKEHSYKWSLAGDDYIKISHVENIAEQLLTKEKEQREELIKGVYADALIDQSIFDCGDINKQELSTIKEKAEQYYKEVFKNYPKQ